MKVSLFDYRLPPEMIAQEPLEPRDASRLLVLHRDSAGAGRIEHRVFRDLPEYVAPGDCLVVNDTRVLAARLRGVREPSGGRVEVLLLRRLNGLRWEVLVKPGRRVRPGDTLSLAGGISVQVEERLPSGGRVISFPSGGAERALAAGEAPLPPYIHAPLENPERYQTIYARNGSSVAAPTAGLHFTPELLDHLEEKARLVKITLDVGLDTFRPVKTEEVEDHTIHTESYEVTEEAARAINEARSRGGRVVAVGTTAARVLETVAGENGDVRPGNGSTGLFVYPGYRFRVVDRLLTNFHLPRSTLLMLVSAFAGRETVLSVYEEAIREGYRFYSFGDAMLVL